MHSDSFEKDRFYVVTVISNSARYDSRYRLYRQFEKYIQSLGVKLFTVELQLCDRPFVITQPNNPMHLQLRGTSEIFHKENLINLGVQRLPNDWKYICWADADVRPLRDDWVEETIHQLQVYEIVQCWKSAIDLGPYGETLAVHKSFMSEYIKNGAHNPECGYEENHPGYLWAATRSGWESIGGLYERAIAGAGDRHSALAFIGQAQSSFHPHVQSAYKESIMQYQAHCETALRRDVGYVDGTLMHYFHGAKKNRHYHSRWQILVRHKFKPEHDLKRNSYGVFELHDDHSLRFIHLRNALRRYFRSRNEDDLGVD